MVADAERSRRSRRRTRGRPPLVDDFYRDAVEAAQRLVLDRAYEVEGLDDDIAMLRTKLHEKARNREEFDLLLKGLNILVRLVTARYRLSPQSAKDLGANMAATLRSIGEQFYQENVGDP